MDKIQFQDLVIALSIDEFHLLLSSLMSKRLIFRRLSEKHPSKADYYARRIDECDVLIEKFSECI